MSARDLFGVIVRTLGLIVALYGVAAFFLFLFEGIGLGIVFGIVGVVVGVYLLRGAPWVMELAYPTVGRAEPQAREGARDVGT